jgi:hypothetical protein
MLRRLSLGLSMICWTWGSGVSAVDSYRPADIASLRQGFAAPPREAGPWVFWIFFENVMAKEEITRELEEMAAAGIAGAELRFLSMHGFSGKPGPWFDPEGWARLGQQPLEFLSPEFVDVLEHACAEAQRLGLRLAIGTGMGWPPGGPWIAPQYRAKHLAWQAREISGPTIYEDKELPPDSMVLAWRLGPNGDSKTVVAGPFRSLTGNIQWQGQTGSMRWEVPEGRWLVGTFRVTLGGLCDKGNGPEADPGSREAVLFHLNHVFGRLDPRLSKYYGTTLVDVTSDSWEYERGGNRYWSTTILDRFAASAGYDLREKMYALLEHGPEQQRVLADLEQVERAVIRENFYETFTRYLNARGLRHRPQVRGRGLSRDLFEAFAESDVPEIEEEVFLPEAVWTAHLLGKPIVSAEAFTFLSGHGRNLERDGQQRLPKGPLADPQRQWETNPAMLRWHAGAHFARGVNRIQMHSFSYSPLGVPPPGWRIYAEVHLNRHVPWWPYIQPLSTWLARMQWVLQSGAPVADVLVYPVRSNPPEGPYNQATDQPVSTLNAIDAARRHTLNRLQGRGGETPYDFSRLVLIDDVQTRDEARQILELVQSGTDLVCCHTMPGDWSAWRHAADAEGLRPAFRAAVESGHVVDARAHGWQRALADAQSVHWPPASVNLSFQHRRVPGGEIYLLTNWEKAFWGDVSFPHVELVPEIWNADTGTCLPAGQYRVEEGRTLVSLALDPHESTFVVFTRAERMLHAVRCDGGRVAYDPDGRLCVRLDGPGPCRVGLSDGQTREFCVTLPPPLALERGWTLAADPGQGVGLAAPVQVALDTLVSWREVPGLRTYAGVARYATSFDLPRDFLREDVSLLLELGAVYELADVWLNGRRVGTSWFPPHGLDITGRVQPGRNQLRIDVPNILKNHFEPGEYARPSGLLGPVRLRPLGTVSLQATAQ